MGGDTLGEGEKNYHIPKAFFFTEDPREKEKWEAMFQEIDWTRLFQLLKESLGENSGVELIKRIQVYPDIRSASNPQKRVKATVDFEGGSLKIGMRYIRDFRVLLSTIINEFVHIFGFIRIERNTTDGVNDIFSITQSGFADLQSVHKNTLRRFNEGTTDMIAREIFRKYTEGKHGNFENSYPKEMNRVGIMVRYLKRKSQKGSEEVWSEIKRYYSEGIDIFEFLQTFGFSESTVLRLLSGTK